MGVFFTIFEKVKKYIFARNFFKMGPIDLKICAKKTCNRSGSSPKILSKPDHFSKIYNIFKLGHFLIPSTVQFKDIVYHLSARMFFFYVEVVLRVMNANQASPR